MNNDYKLPDGFNGTFKITKTEATIRTFDPVRMESLERTIRLNGETTQEAIDKLFDPTLWNQNPDKEFGTTYINKIPSKEATDRE